uniref:Uncharacterized protein n=1 Tax=Kalanchoe fedtschenkoi TaxID=63787 RepID=A0A7N0VC88_KALFE
MHACKPCKPCTNKINSNKFNLEDKVTPEGKGNVANMKAKRGARKKACSNSISCCLLIFFHLKAFQLFVIGSVLGSSYCWTDQKPTQLTARQIILKLEGRKKHQKLLISIYSGPPCRIQNQNLSLSFCASLPSASSPPLPSRVQVFGWEEAMAKFQEQLKEKAKELHLKEKAYVLKMMLKKGAKMVSKTCKKGWKKVKKMAA